MHKTSSGSDDTLLIEISMTHGDHGIIEKLQKVELAPNYNGHKLKWKEKNVCTMT